MWLLKKKLKRLTLGQRPLEKGIILTINFFLSQKIYKSTDKDDKHDNDKSYDEAFWGFWKRASSSGNVFLQKSKAVKALSQHHKRITLKFALSSRGDDDDDDDYVSSNISQASSGCVWNITLSGEETGLEGDWMTESLRESLVQNHLWIYDPHKIPIQSFGQKWLRIESR